MVINFRLDEIDKEDLPIKCSLNPCVTKSPTTGATLLCGGSVVIETDREVSINNISRFLVAEWSALDDKTAIFSDTEITLAPAANKEDFYETQITGSKGDNYLVRFESNYWTCGCVGFGFRRKCKHIEAAKEQYEKSDRNS